MTTSKGLNVSPFDDDTRPMKSHPAMAPIRSTVEEETLNELKGLRADMQKGFEIIGGQIKLLNDLFQKYDSDYVNTVAADGLKPAD